MVRDLESEFHNKTIVLVSHADTLQIMQSFICSHDNADVEGSKGCDSRQFHRFRFKNGEVLLLL